jgi:uncharacterized protein (DUF2267 family)
LLGQPSRERRTQDGTAFAKHTGMTTEDRTEQDRGLAVLVDHLGAAGLTAAEADRALSATLETLGEQLPPLEGRVLAEALPPRQAECLLRGTGRWAPTARAFFEAIACRQGLRRGFGREQAQLVLGALAQVLPGPVVDAVRGALPTALAELLRPGAGSAAEAAEAAEPLRRRGRPRPTPPAVRTTLSSGRPGSLHPVAEADAPPGPRPVLHPRTTLSTGRPGTRHPLVDADAPPPRWP